MLLRVPLQVLEGFLKGPKHAKASLKKLCHSFCATLFAAVSAAKSDDPRRNGMSSCGSVAEGTEHRTLEAFGASQQ